MKPVLVLCALVAVAAAQRSTDNVKVINSWSGGWQGDIDIKAPSNLNGWKIILEFESPISKLEGWAFIIESSTNNQRFVLKNMAHNGVLGQGATFKETFVVRSNGQNPSATAHFEGQGTGNPGTGPKTTQKPNVGPTRPPTGQTTVAPAKTGGKYDYAKILELSIKFYEAQRSGRLPSNNRVPWRGNANLNDRGNNGEDLTGGWFDAGDHVKFGFPMAWSTTQLAWGLIDFRDAYVKAGQLQWMLECIKWPLDYLIKAHVSKNELYGQVGDGYADHGYWGRPEDQPTARPAWKITPSNPGSDLAGETAAAMAAGSMAFKKTDPAYAATLLRHAKELYDFANQHRAKYSDSISNAAGFYKSWSGYGDELMWAAAWLFRATGDNSYLAKAEAHANEFALKGASEEYSWDSKAPGAQTLLFQLTGKQEYKSAMEQYLKQWMPGGGKPYSPKGLVYHSQWGVLRYMSNTAWLALVMAEHGVNTNQYRNWAKGQLEYAMGSGGRSFVIGFGNNPPNAPHHRGASCPNRPAGCSWPQADAGGPSPQILYGALVGGPKQDDSFQNNRKDYINNEVATDYNAGFQSAVAALIHIYK